VWVHNISSACRKVLREMKHLMLVKRLNFDAAFDAAVATARKYLAKGELNQGEYDDYVRKLVSIAEKRKGGGDYADRARRLVGAPRSEVLSPRHLRLLDEGVGFKTFKELKDHLGPPPPGHVWHHIVGQNAENISRFGPEYIHNTANVIAIPHGEGSVHLARIEAFLNSSRPEITGQGFKRVRDWLKTKSYQFQYEYGVMLLKRYGVPLP